jgi:hypothetical protein
MAFNYFNNMSLIGKTKKQTNVYSGIANLSSESVGAISHLTYTVGGVGTNTFSNNPGGISQAVAGNVGDSNGTFVNITYLTSGNVYLNWTFQVSSESGYDYGTLRLNGNILASASGEYTTSGRTLMPLGINTLRLDYGTDGSASSGSDNTIATWSFT